MKALAAASELTAVFPNGIWFVDLTATRRNPVCLGHAELESTLRAARATVTRGARFFLEAYLLHQFGEPMRHFIEKHLTWIALVCLALILAGAWIVVR